MEANNTATYRQRYALFCIFKKDFRNEILTKEEASKMIAEAQTSKPYTPKTKTPKNELLQYLTDNVDKLVSSIASEMKIASVIGDDPMIATENSPKYIFMGGGCGFAFIQFDKRSKKAQAIVESSAELKRTIDDIVVKKIDPDYLKKLERIGNPIEAHLYQNLQYKTTYQCMVVNYMESKGIKGAWVKTQYD